MVLHRPVELAGLIGMWHVVAVSPLELVSSAHICVHIWTDIPGSRIQYCIAQAQREPRSEIHPAQIPKSLPTRTEMAEILYMRIRKQIAWSILLFLTSAVACDSAQTESPASSENIIARMTQAGEHNHIYFQPYVVMRDYQLFDKEAMVPTSEVIAELTF